MSSEPLRTRRSLAHAYGEAVLRRALPGDPAQAARDSATLTLAYRDRFLPGPAFLGDVERRDVVTDLHTVYRLLRSLPERVFGGEVAALGRAVGMDARQVELTVRGARSGRLLPLGRADLYHDGDGFRLLEFNLTSALGGFENADINRAMLTYPPLKDFVRDHRLHYRDTVECMVRTLRAECAEVIPGDRQPVVAVVDTVPNFEIVGPRLRILASMLTGHGVDAFACDLGRITYSGGQPTVEGRPVDVVLRYFLAEDLTESATTTPVAQLLDAVEDSRVGLCSRLDSEVYASKGALVMLSDDRYRDRFDAAERACLDRLLPWTRYVRPRTTDPAGSDVDLLRYAEKYRDELILKPTLLHGGSGITAGWRVDDARWKQQVAAAMSGPFVLQRRVRPEAEPMPDGVGGLQDQFLNWGIYLGDPDVVGQEGYAGGFIRGSADPDVGVVGVAGGAGVGCIFTAEADEHSSPT